MKLSIRTPKNHPHHAGVAQWVGALTVDRTRGWLVTGHDGLFYFCYGPCPLVLLNQTVIANALSRAIEGKYRHAFVFDYPGDLVGKDGRVWRALL